MCKIEQNNNLKPFEIFLFSISVVSLLSLHLHHRVHHHLIRVKLIHIKILSHTHLLHHPIVIYEIILSYHIRTWLHVSVVVRFAPQVVLPMGKCAMRAIFASAILLKVVALDNFEIKRVLFALVTPCQPLEALPLQGTKVLDHAQIDTCFRNCNLGECCSACTLLFCIQSWLDPMVVNTWNVLCCLLLAFLVI